MDTGNSARHLAELQNLTIQFSDKLQEQFIPALANRLLEMADIAKSNEQQWKLLQLSRELKRQKSTLLMGFRRHLAEGFQQFSSGKLGGKDTSSEDMSSDLSLIADEELEQNIAVSSLSRRAETRYAELFYALNQRMAVIKGGRKLPEDGNPLGPYQFASALTAETNVLNLDMPLTVVCFRVFEKLLLDNLGELYQAANEYLIKQGILPNLRYGAGTARNIPGQVHHNNKQPPAAVESRPAAGVVPSAARATPVVADGGSHAAQQQLYTAIREMQERGVAASAFHTGAGSVSSDATVPSSPGNKPAYSPGYFSQPAYTNHGNTAVAICSRGEVVTALSGVQIAQHAEALEQVVVPPAMTVEQYQAVTSQLREQLGADKQIGDDDSRMIDLVGMIFEYMLGDKQLPDSVKAVLSYLHTPYLKVAFIDRGLFEKPGHPSRQLLDCLAEAGMRWVNSDGDSQFKVFPKIKSVVRRVLTEFRSDVKIFEDLLAEMQEFNQKVQHSIGLMERRAREKAEGEDRLREVKRRVMIEVRKRMEGHDLPSPVVILLLHPWSDYLTFTLLRHGIDSVMWQEGLDTIDDIIWSIEPKEDANARNRLMLIQESLQARIQAGLETIAFDQAKSNKLIDAVQKAQMLALQNIVAEPLESGKRAEMEAEAGSGLEQETVDPTTLGQAEQEVLEQLRQVEFGTWIEFDQLDDHRNLRAKIAWFNSQTSRYMLVDRSGKQVAMKSGIELARLILASQARMLALSGKPFFERALENIFARLKAAMAH